MRKRLIAQLRYLLNFQPCKANKMNTKLKLDVSDRKKNFTVCVVVK